MDSLYNNPDFIDVVHRYQEMERTKKSAFFDVDEYEFLIEHYLQNGEPKVANKIVELALNQHPNATSIKLRQAQLLIDFGNYNKALQLLESLENFDSLNSELYLLKGIACNFTGRQVDARKFFELAIQYSEETKADVLYNIAVNYENLNFFDIALKHLLEALLEDAENLTILFETAYCYDKIDDYSNAKAYYNQYLDINPFSDVVWFNLGVIHSKIYEFEKAIEAYDFALALNENNILAYYNKGNALANSGKYTEAICCYNEYLAFEPEHPETLCFIGECYERSGDLKNAIHYYTSTLENEPLFADAIFGIGIVYSIQEDFKESLKFILKAIELDSNNSDYWFSLGNVYGKLNNNDKAIEAYNKSIELDPYDYESWLNLSELYFKKNLLTKAIKTLEDAYSYNSDVALLNYRLAAYNLLRHNIPEGMVYFRKAIKTGFDDHTELFKICPNAKEIKEISDLIKQFNHIKQ